MNSRKPTKAESIYLEAAAMAVGCVACNKLGYENDYLPEQLAVHHNPDKGSKEKLCHFFGVPLCGVHHQGAVPSGLKLPEGEPVRHGQGEHYRAFMELIGSDIDMCKWVWDRISLDAKDRIGEITSIYSFEDLEKYDNVQRNVRIS
ncbi:Ref family recombination enhancement nuclease [Vibrio harveyi]|uniref:Ref family recombination enhancement nuclease n=1 Tax=Vibrio harveyi TaxID=669 RepID=UPI002380A801|nr:Ref family recombination enhancement nuclease [Vibrio harveyi]